MMEDHTGCRVGFGYIWLRKFRKDRHLEHSTQTDSMAAAQANRFLEDRRSFAEEYIGQPAEFWSKLIFADECRFKYDSFFLLILFCVYLNIFWFCFYISVGIIYSFYILFKISELRLTAKFRYSVAWTGQFQRASQFGAARR